MRYRSNPTERKKVLVKPFMGWDPTPFEAFFMIAGGAATLGLVSYYFGRASAQSTQTTAANPQLSSQS